MIKNTGLSSIFLLGFLAFAQADAGNRIQETYSEGVVEVNVTKGTDAFCAYRYLLDSAKKHVIQKDKISGVKLKKDGVLIYSMDPKFYVLLGKNQRRQRLDPQYLERLMGMHSFNPDGNRAFATPSGLHPSRKQVVRRRHFNEYMSKWTGSEVTTKYWDAEKAKRTQDND
ncbi:hypothetical protein ACI2KR_09090 [Pseudomonas luteola]